MLNQDNYKESSYFKRRSIRRYLDKPIEEWKLNALVESVFQCPSAKNQQPWEVILLTDKELISKCAKHHKYGHFFKEAQAMIVIGSVEDFNSRIPNPEIIDHDLAGATMQTVLLAHDLGLGATWCALYPRLDREAGFKLELGVPESCRLFSAIPLGYPAEEKTPNNRYLKERIHKNGW